MSDLILNKPANITLRDGQKLSVVSSDVYKIADRVKELDPNLRLILHEGHEKPWVVTEFGTDGVEYFVSRYEELGPHIIEHLKYMRSVPLEQRVAKLAQEADKANERLGHWDGDKFEEFSYDFHKAMREANMIMPHWGKSFRPVKKKKG